MINLDWESVNDSTKVTYVLLKGLEEVENFGNAMNIRKGVNLLL